MLIEDLMASVVSSPGRQYSHLRRKLSPRVWENFR